MHAYTRETVKHAREREREREKRTEERRARGRWEGNGERKSTRGRKAAVEARAECENSWSGSCLRAV